MVVRTGSASPRVEVPLLGPAGRRLSAGPAAPPGSPREVCGCVASALQESELRVWPAVWAGVDAFGEGPQCDVPRHAPAPLACHVASADVHVDGWRVPVEAAFDHPVRLWWPGVDAALALLLAAFGVCDLLPDPIQAEGEPRLQDAEAR